jgi:hypothetical protein
MRAALEETGVGVVVHLPFAVNPGSPFEPVRDSAVDELIAGVDLSADLGAETAASHPSSEAWDPGWSGAETLEIDTKDRDVVATGRRRVEELRTTGRGRRRGEAEAPVRDRPTGIADDRSSVGNGGADHDAAADRVDGVSSRRRCDAHSSGPIQWAGRAERYVSSGKTYIVPPNRE